MLPVKFSTRFPPEASHFTGLAQTYVVRDRKTNLLLGYTYNQQTERLFACDGRDWVILNSNLEQIGRAKSRTCAGLKLKSE